MKRKTESPGDEILRRSYLSLNECLVWTGPKGRKGYGLMTVGGKCRQVHRIAWEIVNGQIPAGMICCHHCDNPPCCNPEHLFLGTHKDNKHDAIAKGRHAHGVTHSRARLTEDDIRAIRADTRPHTIVAVEYGVGDDHICRIRSRFVWKHLT